MKQKYTEEKTSDKADFTGCDLTGSVFDSCDLMGASFENVFLIEPNP